MLDLLLANMGWYRFDVLNYGKLRIEDNETIPFHRTHLEDRQQQKNEKKVV